MKKLSIVILLFMKAFSVYSQHTIVDHSTFLTVTNGSKITLIQKPFTTIVDPKDIILSDLFGNQELMKTSILTGWTFSSSADLAQQLSVLNSVIFIDAPVNGNIYGRKNNLWTIVPGVNDFIKKDGTTALTGNWNIGAFTISSTKWSIEPVNGQASFADGAMSVDDLGRISAAEIFSSQFNFNTTGHTYVGNNDGTQIANYLSVPILKNAGGSTTLKGGDNTGSDFNLILQVDDGDNSNIQMSATNGWNFTGGAVGGGDVAFAHHSNFTWTTINDGGFGGNYTFNLAAADDGGTNFSIVGTKGAFIPPKMTTTQRMALTAIEGMTVYDTTLHKLAVYNGTVWTLF